MDAVDQLLPLPALDVRRDEDDHRVLLVRLDDADRRNVMSEQMTASWRRLTDALAAGETDPVGAVVLTGAGTAFSSGGELSWLAAGSGAPVEGLRQRMSRYYDDWLSLRRLQLPVVAAVNGPAVGAGAALALACDIRLVGASATVSVPFTALGLHPGMGVTATLVAVAGEAVARELLLTGRRVGAEEAVRLGLASALHADEELLEAALGVARTIASRAPVATRLTMQALAAGGHPDLGSALRWEALAQAVTLATDDLAEGVAAHAERRAPRFVGR